MSQPSRTRELAEIAAKRVLQYDETTFFSLKHSSLLDRRAKKPKPDKKKKKRKHEREKEKEKEQEPEPGRGRESRSRSLSPVVVLQSVSVNKTTNTAVEMEVRLSPPPELSTEVLEAAKNALLDKYNHVESERSDDDGLSDTQDAAADLMPELAARLRARKTAAHQQFVVHVLVETTLTHPDEFGTEVPMKASVFKIKSSYPFKKIRLGWQKKYGLDEDVVLLDKNTFTKLYDDSTPDRVGVTQHDPNMNILAVRPGDVEKLRQLLAASDPVEPEPSESDPDADVENDTGINIFLQDGHGERLCLRVKPESKISQVISYYRKKRNLAPDVQVTLEMDDERIRPDLSVADTEIEDEVIIDVHAHTAISVGS